MPPIARTAVIAGSALSIAIAVLLSPFIGVAAGGAFAGATSRNAPLYSGALVGVATILAVVLVVPAAAPSETLQIFLWDAGLLLVGALSALAGSRLAPLARRS